MSMNMKKIEKNESKGITLIALVVTIVVLLILAGISISIVLGEGGIIDSARRAGEETNGAIANEQQMLQNVVNWVDDYLSENGGSTNTEEGDPPPEVNKNTIPDEYGKTQTANKEVTDGEKKLTIPEGYTVVDPDVDTTVYYEDKKDPKVDEGIVISDSMTDGNEFVWVPVKDITKMVICQEHGTNSEISYDKDTRKFTCSKCSDKVWKSESWENRLLLAGRLYGIGAEGFNANTTGQEYIANDGLREPDVLTSTDYGDASTDEDKGIALMQEAGIIESTDTTWSQVEPKWKKRLQDDFDKIIESVAIYKGFYIGRFETGGLSNDNPKETKAVVKAGRTDISNTNWYNMYVESQNIAKDKKSVISSMILGSQWDQVMIWMKNEKNPTVEGNKSYIEDSSGMGWYIDNWGDGNPNLETGKDLVGIDANSGKILNRVKNIYDMAGNVWDCTVEGYETFGRVFRGGYYAYDGWGRFYFLQVRHIISLPDSGTHG